MSLSSALSFGMLPNEDDFSENTPLGEWEQEWDQKIESMEQKKQARKSRGIGASFQEQAMSPAFSMMERPLQAQMYAATHQDLKSDDEQSRVERKTVNARGEETVDYTPKTSSGQFDDSSSGLENEAPVHDAAQAARAAAYAAAMKPKFQGTDISDNHDREMTA